MENVCYLEIEDVNPDGTLKPHVNLGKPMVVMAQGNFCGYCKQAAPDFQKFASSQDIVLAGSIVIDGEPSEAKLGKMLSSWDKSYQGVPFYLGFNSNGQFVRSHKGNRDANSITEFAKSIAGMK